MALITATLTPQASTATATVRGGYLKPDIRTQIVQATLGLDETTLDVTLARPLTASLTNVFVRLLSVCNQSAGTALGGGADTRDLGVIVEVLNSTQIRFRISPTASATDVKVFAEVWEYIGPSGGPNEFIVRNRGDVSIADTVTSGTLTFTGTVDIDKVVPVMAGVYSTTSSGKQNSAVTGAPTVVDSSPDYVQIDRTDNSADVVFSVQAVEFTGANWLIEQVTPYAASSSPVTASGPFVNNQTFALGWITHESANLDALEDVGFVLRLTNGNQLTTLTASGADHVTHAYLIGNPRISVQVLNSITFTIFTNRLTADFTATTFPAHLASIVGYAYTDGATTNYPQAHWGYLLDSVLDGEFQRTDIGTLGVASAQRVLLPRPVIDCDIDAQAATATAFISRRISVSCAAQARPASTREPAESELFAVDFDPASMPSLPASFASVYGTSKIPLATTASPNGWAINTTGSARSLGPALTLNGELWVVTVSTDDNGTALPAVINSAPDVYVTARILAKAAWSPAVIIIGTLLTGTDSAIFAAPSLAQPNTVLEIAYFDQTSTIISLATGPMTTPVSGDILRGRVTNRTSTFGTLAGGINVYSVSTLAPVSAFFQAGVGLAALLLQSVDSVSEMRVGRVVAATQAFRYRTGTIDATAETATADIAGVRVIEADVAASAATATTNIVATRVHEAAVDATAETATVSIAVDRVLPASIDASAVTATADLTAVRYVIASITPQAETATVAIAVARLVEASISASAETATASIDADRVVPTAIDATAETATVAIAADSGPIGLIFAAAERATASLTGELVHPASIDATAEVATAAIDADRIIPTTVSADAETATAAITGETQNSADIDATAETATASVDADRIVPASVDATAETATTSAQLDRVIPTTIDATAETATASLTATFVIEASITANAETATVAIAVARVREADVAASADVVAVVLLADRVIPTTIDATAETATVSISVDLSNGASIDASAETATVALDVDLIRTANISADADTATVTLLATRVIEASITAAAETATVSIAGGPQGAASINATAETATVAIALDRVLPASISAAAETATVAIAVARVREAAVAAAAGPASASISGDVIRVASIAADAETATAALTADRIIPTTVDAAAEPATVVLIGTLNAGIAADIDARASTATTAIDAARVLLTDLAVSGQATVAIDADRVIPTTIDAQLGLATADITATRIDSDAFVNASAETATTSIDVTIVRPATIDAQAETATAALTATRVIEASVAANAETATVAILIGRRYEAAIDATAETAIVELLADRILPTTIDATAEDATASITGDDLTIIDIDARASTATASITGTVYRSATIDAQAEPATVDLQVSLQFQIDLDAQASRATASLTGELIHECDIDANAGDVYVICFDYTRVQYPIPIEAIAHADDASTRFLVDVASIDVIIHDRDFDTDVEVDTFVRQAYAPRHA